SSRHAASASWAGKASTPGDEITLHRNRDAMPTRRGIMPRNSSCRNACRGQPCDRESMDHPLIVFGREDEECRALFVVSALYHCTEVLSNRPIRFVEVDDVAVEIAVEVLRFDTGLLVDVVPRGVP